MIIVDHLVFAIESIINRAYANPGSRALGSFVIHVGGFGYGVRSSDSTMLACAFDEVKDRIDRRGRNVAVWVAELDARKISGAFCNEIYAGDHAEYFLVLFNLFFMILSTLIIFNGPRTEMRLSTMVVVCCNSMRMIGFA